MTSLRSFIKELVHKKDYVVVVSGLPRSGTSMMMSALAEGGMDLLTDQLRVADANNPMGYYEFERVKKLPKGDINWLHSAEGKAVKIISALLSYLPSSSKYRVIFMERDLDEILASQNRMLDRIGKETNDALSETELRLSYESHLSDVKTWLNNQDWVKTLFVSYNNVLCQPEDEFSRVAAFLDRKVDPVAMAHVVDPSLYREKKQLL